MPKRAQIGAVLGEAVTTSGGGRGSWYVVMQPRAHERARPSARSPQASGEPEGVCGPRDSCWGEMAVIEVVRPLRLRTEREIVACRGCTKTSYLLESVPRREAYLPTSKFIVAQGVCVHVAEVRD